MDDSVRYHGSIIAFEGIPETISTQLRLLPMSSQILILPGIQNYLKNAERAEPFSARQLIRRVHAAAAARHQTALDFLRQSTSERNRFVFMNGGTVSAQALCISAISKHQTNGDIVQADSIFNGLVRDGVPGLLKDITTWRDSIRAEDRARMSKPGRKNGKEAHGLDRASDPITRAMMAAEALDRETESLQPPGRDLDLTISLRHARSVSLPVLDFTDDFQDTTPFFVFGASSDSSASVGESTAPTSLITTPVKTVEMIASVGRRPMRISVVRSACSSHAGEVCDVSTYPLFSPLSDTHTSPPSRRMLLYSVRPRLYRCATHQRDGPCGGSSPLTACSWATSMPGMNSAQLCWNLTCRSCQHLPTRNGGQGYNNDLPHT